MPDHFRYPTAAPAAVFVAVAGLAAAMPAGAQVPYGQENRAFFSGPGRKAVEVLCPRTPSTRRFSYLVRHLGIHPPEPAPNEDRVREAIRATLPATDPSRFRGSFFRYHRFFGVLAIEVWSASCEGGGGLLPCRGVALSIRRHYRVSGNTSTPPRELNPPIRIQFPRGASQCFVQLRAHYLLQVSNWIWSTPRNRLVQIGNAFGAWTKGLYFSLPTERQVRFGRLPPVRQFVEITFDHRAGVGVRGTGWPAPLRRLSELQPVQLPVARLVVARSDMAPRRVRVRPRP